MIDVLAASPFASVQDTGRTGYRDQGISIGGAMDVPALRAGNRLVGNADTAAGIECAAGPLIVRFAAATMFAVTGAPASITLDGLALPNFWCAVADEGQKLEIRPTAQGMWTYLCIAGGLDTPSVFGSRSTDLKMGLGGPCEGKALQAGTRLAVQPADDALRIAVGALGGYGVPRPELVVDRDGHRILRVIPAREYDAFPPEVRDTFWHSPWTVGRDSNRMGYRLSGPELRPRTPMNLPSYGLVTGIVQVPPSGQPIVQLSEANTCGGYPKMGVVIQADLPALVQTRPGECVRMQKVDRAGALAARAGARGILEQITTAREMIRAWT